MKKSQLRKIINEEIRKVLKEEEIKLENVLKKLISKYNAKSEMDLIKKLKDQYKDEFKINLTPYGLVGIKQGQPIPKDVWGDDIVPFINKLIGSFPPPPNNAIPPIDYIVNSIKMGAPEDLK